MTDMQEKARWYVLVLCPTEFASNERKRRELVRAYTAADAIASYVSPHGYKMGSGSETRGSYGPAYRITGVEPYEPDLRESHKEFESFVAHAFGRKEFGY